MVMNPNEGRQPFPAAVTPPALVEPAVRLEEIQDGEEAQWTDLMFEALCQAYEEGHNDASISYEFEKLIKDAERTVDEERAWEEYEQRNEEASGG